MSDKEIVSTEAEAEKNVYEVGFHLVPSVPQDEVGTIFSAFKSDLEKKGATIMVEGSPKMMTLSYTMKKAKAGKYTKYNQSYFGWIKFKIGSEKISEMDDEYTANEQILRYIIIKTVPENTMSIPKAQTFSKAKNADGDIVSKKKESEEKEVKEVSETEIDKALDAAIAE